MPVKIKIKKAPFSLERLRSAQEKVSLILTFCLPDGNKADLSNCCLIPDWDKETKRKRTRNGMLNLTSHYYREFEIQRLVYMLVNNPDWDKFRHQKVWHLCGNRDCVRPAHLVNYNPKPVPKQYNFGENNGRSKLTAVTVKKIRRYFDQPKCDQKWTMKQMAKALGVSYKTVRRVVKGETWKRGNG